MCDLTHCTEDIKHVGKSEKKEGKNVEMDDRWLPLHYITGSTA